MKSAMFGSAPRRDHHEEVLPRVVEVLSRVRRVLCVMHAEPDGDACGATLALALALGEMGKDATIFCHTEVLLPPRPLLLPSFLCLGFSTSGK